MITEKQPKEKKEEYRQYIRAVCALSNMFSESNKPYIDYRIAENLFCRCFGAENLSRSDCSIDARLDAVGIGIKTFLDNGSSYSYQKIAEFNKDSSRFRHLNNEEMAEAVSQLRNERIDFTKRAYGVSDTIYHCLVRGELEVRVIECPLDSIILNKIKIESGRRGENIHFTDGLCDYHFNKSKSTLYRRFNTDEPCFDVSVSILEDPYEILLKILEGNTQALAKPETPYVVLPLYSVKKKERYVPEHSGLNQWNAAGRRRNLDEVYIPVPTYIHKQNPDFFPGRDTSFDLRLPDGKTILSAKICQDGGKALMTNPNSDLGDWILRKVLNVPEGVAVTYERLEIMGINCVKIYRNGTLDYSIDFGYIDIFAGTEKGPPPVGGEASF